MVHRIAIVDSANQPAAIIRDKQTAVMIHEYDDGTPTMFSRHCAMSRTSQEAVKAVEELGK